MPPRPGSAIPTGSSGRGRRPLPDEGHLPPGAWGAGARAWEAGLSGRPGVPLHPRPRHQRLHARAYVASDGVGARRGGEESRGFKDCALRLGRSSTAPTTPGTHRRSRSGMRPARRFAYTTRGWTWQRRRTRCRGSRGTLRGCLPPYFAGHREDRGLMPGKVRRRCGSGCAGCDGVGGEVVVIARRPGTRSPGPVQEPRQTGYSGSIQKALNRPPP